MRRAILAAACGLSLLGGCTGAAGVGVGAGAGAAGVPSPSALYTVGRVMEYVMTSNAAGQNITDTITQEVTEVKDGKATLKVTTKAGSSTTTIDLNDKDAFAKMGSPGQMPAGVTVTPGDTSNETVTVPAGTYACVKTSYTSKVSQSGVNSESTSEAWTNSAVGLVKLVSTTKLAMPAGMPNMPSMPGIPAGMGDVKTTMELKSFT